MITGELIRMQNYCDDAENTLRRIKITIQFLDATERKALAEHMRSKTVTFTSLLAELDPEKP